MPLTFTQRVQIEQLKAMEASNTLPKPDTTSIGGEQAPFEDWLWLRTLKLKQILPAGTLENAANRFAKIQWGLWLLFAVLGFLSATGLIDTQQDSVNVFWLMGTLLGANALTLGLWVILTIVLRSHQGTIISTLLSWSTKRLLANSAINSERRSANGAWWRSHLSQTLRPWQLSVLTHQGWLAFLAGCFIGVALSFTTQRYEFVWESTLLSEQQLKDLLSMLATPLGIFGFSAPIGKADLTPEITRQHWAWFILLSLLVYAVLPRALALLIARITLHQKQKHWQLDLSSDYYIQRHAEYRQLQNQSQVIDQEPRNDAPATEAEPQDSVQPPSNADWYGLEVAPSIPWAKRLPGFRSLINNQESLQKVIADIQHSTTPSAVFVDAQRLPDRGLIRSLKALNGENVWLVILATGKAGASHSANWLDAAIAAGIPPERCSQTTLEIQDAG